MNTELAAVRGVLRPQPAQGAFHHERRLPSAQLAGLVEHYWHVRWDLRGLPPQQQATLPHPSIHLVVERSAAMIHGVHTGRFERRLEGQDFAFGIKFKPGGFHPFLKAPVSALANRTLPAQAVFGAAGESLAPHIVSCATVDEMSAVAEAFLLAHLPPHDPDVARAGKLVAMIAGELGMTSVDHVMAATGIEKRVLQRLFRKYVGIGPKWVIKRYRLHEAVARIQEGAPVDWVGLALELGYFDQAHFARDFRALVGQSPTAYARAMSTQREDKEKSKSG